MSQSQMTERARKNSDQESERESIALGKQSMETASMAFVDDSEMKDSMMMGGTGA
jgi:hypothetical protein